MGNHEFMIGTKCLRVGLCFWRSGPSGPLSSNQLQRAWHKAKLLYLRRHRTLSNQRIRMPACEHMGSIRLIHLPVEERQEA